VNTKISLALVAIVAVIIGAVLFFARDDSEPQALAQTDGKVTVVEFLDLECPACGAAYPGVAKLKEEYAGKVDFQLRHFPIPSHVNAEQAACAVEAAGAKRDDMFKLMYTNQRAWAGQQTSQRETFLSFAKELNLDLTEFQKVMDDPKTLEKVRAERSEGSKLGVRGTPTFFINGEKFEEAPTYNALKTAIDEALAK
jgi:protein-disulfide isomerase